MTARRVVAAVVGLAAAGCSPEAVTVPEPVAPTTAPPAPPESTTTTTVVVRPATTLPTWRPPEPVVVRPATTLPTWRPPEPVVPSPQGAPLACIRRYESGGDYGAVSPDGRYSGAYQADRQTWNGYGGYATAGEAPPSVQDDFAADLYATRGLQPWPTPERNC